MTLSYSDSILMVDGHTLETPWIIKEAFELEGRIIVLMNTFSDQATIREVERTRNGRNLVCYSADLALLWKAEFPNGSNFQDYYY
jgi:hypothetical protein